MKEKTVHLLYGVLILSLFISSALASENKKFMQTVFQFLCLVSDVRAVSMVEAMPGLRISASALYYGRE